MRKFTDFVVQHRVTMGVLLFVVFFFGTLSARDIGVKLMPDITPPSVAVVTIYPGADPQTVEEQVSIPLERILSATSGLRHIRTTSLENLSIVLLELEWGSDPDPVIDGLRTTLDRARLSLPSEAQAPLVVNGAVVRDPVMVTGLRAGADVRVGRLTHWADEMLKPSIERLSGVTQVAVLGGARPQVEIVYEPDELAALGLGTTQIRQGLSLQNITVPTGILIEDGTRFATRVGHEIRSLDDLRRMVVSVQPPDPDAPGLLALLPKVITLSDVAAVERTLATPDGRVAVNGDPGLILFVYQRPGANTLDVTGRVRQRMEALLAAPEAQGIEARTIYDGAEFIRLSTGNVIASGALGAVLAVLVLWLFVRRIGLALLIGLSIPFSILLSLILVNTWGISLNLLTLGGLAIAVGMLVDNSIVVVENIARSREELPPTQAASVGTAEVGSTLVISTLTNMMVFLPVVLTQNQTQAVLGELGWTVLLAMFASLIVAVTVIPSLASRMLGRLPRSGQSSRARGDPTWFERVTRTYISGLKRVLRRPVVLLGACAVLFAASIAGWAGLSRTFLPQIDDSSLMVQVTLPPGSTLDQTGEAAATAWRVIHTIPEVKHVVTRVGNPSAGTADLAGLLRSIPPNQAQLLVLLRPQSERDRRHSEVADQIRRKMQHPRFAEFDVRVEEGAGLGVLATLTQNTVELAVYAPTRAQAEATAQELAERLRAEEGLFSRVHVTSDDRQPRLFFEVNPSKALTTGVTAGRIGLSVRQALGDDTVTTLQLDGERIPVVMRPHWGADDRLEGRESLKDLPVSTQAEGATLGTVSTLREGTSPTALQRVDRRAAIRVNARLADAASADAAAMEAATAVSKQHIADLALPPGTTITDVGFDQMASDGLGDLSVALALSVLLVYLVMAAHFESFLKPFPILLTLPMGSVGAFALILWAGEPLSVSVLMGLIVLVGIAVNNGILLVHTASRFEREGRPRAEAILMSGSRRLRPVLMTTLTTVLGLLPLGFGVGEGSEIQRPLALTLIGGLLLQTAATLFVLPLLYDRIEAWRLPGLPRRPLEPAHGPTHPPPAGRDWGFGAPEPELAAATDPEEPEEPHRDPEDDNPKALRPD